MTDIIDRIQYLIDTEGFNVGSFAKAIGVKDQTIRNSIRQRKSRPSFDVLHAICQSFNWLNARWLLTGEGEYKLKENIQSTHALNSNEQFFKDLLMKQTKIIEEQAITIKSQQLSIAKLLDKNEKGDVLLANDAGCADATGSGK